MNDDLNELKEKNKGLEEENILLRQELENEKAKNKEQNEDNGNEIKGGKYNLFVSYVTQLLNEMKPNEGKEKYLHNKLKGIIEKAEKENNCNEEEEKEELKKKEESERIECQYCGESMSYTLIDDHENMCGSRSDNCQICGQLLLVRNMRKHLKNHEFQNIMKLRQINYFELNSMNEDEMLARAMAESMFY